MKPLTTELQKTFYFFKYGEGWKEKEKTHLECLYESTLYGVVPLYTLAQNGLMKSLIRGRPIEATALLDVLGIKKYCYYCRSIGRVGDGGEGGYSLNRICDWKQNTPLHLQSEKTQKIILKLIQKLK